MVFPISTGAVVRLLHVAETRLVHLIRQGRIEVPVVFGRRAWDRCHVLRAAKLLGLDTPEVRNLCAEPPAPAGEGPHQ